MTQILVLKNKAAALAILGLLLLTVYAMPAYAQEPDYDQINQIAQELNCPTCVGINLADCRTQTCTQWKDQIGDLVAQGYSEQEVLDYFVTQYGTQVLQEPPKSGFTLALWVLPFALLFIGGGWLFYTMRRWSRPEPEAEPSAGAPGKAQPAAASGNDYLSQVEKDLGLE